MYATAMLIAAISDTHDNLVNIDIALAEINRREITHLIHCGDTSTFDTLAYIHTHFQGKIYTTLGNDEKSPETRVRDARTLSRCTQFESVGEVSLANTTIGFVHYPEAANLLARSGVYNIVLYGHTHKPWKESVGTCMLLNPGNIAGLYYPPSFAIINLQTRVPELIPLSMLTK